MMGFGFLFLTGMYFLPTIVAAARGTRSVPAIGALNFFTGWTFVGWVAALIWALSADRRERQVVYVSQHVHVPPYPYGPYAQPRQYFERNGPLMPRR